MDARAGPGAPSSAGIGSPAPRRTAPSSLIGSPFSPPVITLFRLRRERLLVLLRSGAGPGVPVRSRRLRRSRVRSDAPSHLAVAHVAAQRIFQGGEQRAALAAQHR